MGKNHSKRADAERRRANEIARDMQTQKKIANIELNAKNREIARLQQQKTEMRKYQAEQQKQLAAVLSKVTQRSERSANLEKRMGELQRSHKRKLDEIIHNNSRVKANNEQLRKKTRMLDQQVKDGIIGKKQAEEQVRKIEKENSKVKLELKKRQIAGKARQTFSKLRNLRDLALTEECTRALIWATSTDKTRSKIDELNKMTMKQLEALALKTPDKFFALNFDTLYRALNEFRWPKPKVPETYTHWEDSRIKIAVLGLSGTGKTTFYKKMISILGMRDEAIRSLKLAQGDFGEQTLSPTVVQMNYHMNDGSPVIPIAVYDTAGLNGLKHAKEGVDDENLVYDRVVKYAQEHGLAYMDAVFLVVNGRFDDREEKVLSRVRPFCKTFIIRNKVDQALDYEEYNLLKGTDFRSKEEYLPTFKKESYNYFKILEERGNPIEKDIFFVQSNKPGTEKLYDFPKLLNHLQNYLLNKLSNPEQIDPIERAVQNSKIPGRDDKEMTLLRKIFE